MWRVFAWSNRGLGGRLVVPFLPNDSKADGLVNVPVQRPTVALPDPKLLVVVILAAIGQLFGLDEYVVEEVSAD